MVKPLITDERRDQARKRFDPNIKRVMKYLEGRLHPNEGPEGIDRLERVILVEFERVALRAGGPPQWKKSRVKAARQRMREMLALHRR